MSNLLTITRLEDVELVAFTNEDWRSVLDFSATLTGITLRMDVRVRADDEVAALSIGSHADYGSTIVIDGSDASKANLAVPVATMRTVPPAVYVFDFVGTASEGTRILASGTVDLRAGVTR